MEDYVSQVLFLRKSSNCKRGKKLSKVIFSGYVMIEANLVGEIPHIIKSITSVIGFR
jgi:transcriptional antiterminator NusG